VGAALGSGNEVIGAVTEARDHLREVKGTAGDIGLWDFVLTLVQQPLFWRTAPTGPVGHTLKLGPQLVGVSPIRLQYA
jgi:hypothetical protein